MMISKRVKRWLRLSPFAKMPVYHWFRFIMKRKGIDRVLQKSGVWEDKKTMRYLMRRAMILHRWDFDEVIMYDYRDLSDEGRRSFVPEYDKNIFCDKVNDYEASKVFDSKWLSYCKFRDYYHRSCVCVSKSSIKNNEQLSSFLRNHLRFILKPDSAACGRGILIIDATNETDALNRINEGIGNSDGLFVIEELIVQNEEMGRFHPQSVNTVRIPTIRFDDRVEIVHPFVRIGRGESIVDNAGAGGVFGNIETETGCVYAACDEIGHQFSIHPDTGIPIVGFVIPHWKEAVSFAKDLAMVVPSVRYVGWDLALTDKGWLMVEGNDKGQFVFQCPDQKGFRNELIQLETEIFRKII